MRLALVLSARLKATKRRSRLGDRVFRAMALSAGLFVLLLVGLITSELVTGAMPVLEAKGLEFFTGTVWSSSRDQYGALAPAYGTIISSLIALILGGTVGVSVSSFLVELAPKWMVKPVGFLVDLLAAIPSIIYGIWGMLVLAPFLGTHVYPQLATSMSWTGFFTEDFATQGKGLLTAGLVLAIMITPTVAAITREVLMVVPRQMRDGALALGANKTEALRTVQIPFASSGILGALILGLGRALGETMAVTMVIGNSPQITRDLFSSAASLASIIANDFGEASGLQRSALIGLGLMLFCLTLLLNVLARLLVNRVRKNSGVTA